MAKCSPSLCLVLLRPMILPGLKTLLFSHLFIPASFVCYNFYHHLAIMPARNILSLPNLTC